MRPNRLEVFGSGRYHYVRLVFGNGEKAMVSESYTRRRDAFRAALAIEGALAIGRPVVKGGRSMARKKKSRKGGRPC